MVDLGNPVCLVKFAAGLNNQIKDVMEHRSRSSKCAESTNTIEKVKTKKRKRRDFINSVRPFWCTLCGRSFAREQSLSVHSIIHKEHSKRPFECGYCLKRFQTKQNVIRHENIHLGLKPFECKICYKSFTETSTLKKHMVTHSGERRYSCEFCSKKFSQIGSMQRHVESQHNHVSQFGNFLPALGAEIVANELMILETSPTFCEPSNAFSSDNNVQ